MTRVGTRVAARALAAIFPPSDRLPGLDRARAEAFLDEMQATSPLRARALFAACFALFQVTPVVTVRRPTLAAFLSDASLDEHAHRLAKSDAYLLRQAMLMLKTVGGMAWGADPGVRAALRFPAYGPDPGTRRAS